jgi:hypothetical protein
MKSLAVLLILLVLTSCSSIVAGQDWHISLKGLPTKLATFNLSSDNATFVKLNYARQQFSVAGDLHAENLTMEIDADMNYGIGDYRSSLNISCTADWKNGEIIIAPLGDSANVTYTGDWKKGDVTVSVNQKNETMLSYEFVLTDLPKGYHQLTFDGDGAGLYFNYTDYLVYFYGIDGSCTLDFTNYPPAENPPATPTPTTTPTSTSEPEEPFPTIFIAVIAIIVTVIITVACLLVYFKKLKH